MHEHGDFETSGPAGKCPQCKEKKQGSGAGKKMSRSAAVATAKGRGSAGVSSVQHESVKVIETLVAIGAVTSAQVESTRKYVREMFGEMV